MSKPVSANVLIRFHVGRDRSAQLRAAIKGKGAVRRNERAEVVSDLVLARDRGKPPVRGETFGGGLQVAGVRVSRPPGVPLPEGEGDA